jgi:hypothetical protein
MFNSVQYVRDVCKYKKIAISQLEKDCNFSNGYLNPKKISQIPFDRAKRIAEYLSISVAEVLTGKPEEKEKTPDQLELTEGEVAFIKLLRRVPAEDRPIVIEKILSALDAQV